MRRPTRIRSWATASLPRKPRIAAAATAPRYDTGAGWSSRSTAAQPAATAEIVMKPTMMMPARSSARPNPYV